jgi:hypothetical protein
VAEHGWDRFEWDDEKKKNGNVQHLRDHDIEPEEAEECFSTITISPLTTDVSTTCILSMEKLIGAEDCGSFSKIKEMDWLVFLRVGN